ncbi:MAG: 6-phosphogluconolactonase, partial [Clostridia bacterium]|nr:6-phosphogluconolactonase [Clostridia bacterium]
LAPHGLDMWTLTGAGHEVRILPQLGFNEPGESYSKGTCVAELTESTIQANRRFFDSEDQVPRRALTMGIRTIFRAREILLIACGTDKAKIIGQAVRGGITPRVPASVLQLHPNARLLIDREAAAAL